MAEGPVSNILMTIEESKEKFMHSSVNVHLISQIKHLIGLSLYMPTFTRQNFWLKLSHGTCLNTTGVVTPCISTTHLRQRMRVLCFLSFYLLFPYVQDYITKQSYVQFKIT